jgi:aminoglycoside/choline kinase family phosphotransferase
MSETRLPVQPDTRTRIDQCLRRAGFGEPHVRVVPLTGDASTRQYFRILRPDNPSVVLAVYDSPFAFDNLAFVNVSELFASIPLPIPAIAGHADDLGVLILEDLGDITLQAHLGMTSPTEHDALYRQAVELVFRMQKRGADLHSDKYLPFNVAFDREKLTWELNFFVKHFLEAYKGSVISTAVRQALDEEWLTLADEIAGEPRVLCHRDYHSRNLMLHDRRLYIIDFQDARMGPDTYDLASLLRDSYVDMSDARMDELIGVFLRLGGAAAATLRSHGAAAQPEGARHVRTPDHVEKQPGLHPVHPAHGELRQEQSRAVSEVRPPARSARTPYVVDWPHEKVRVLHAPLPRATAAAGTSRRDRRARVRSGRSVRHPQSLRLSRR